MSNVVANPYLMESSEEGARLEDKTDAAFAESNLRLAGLAEGMKALDVGCGTGAVTRAMNLLTHAGTFGIDASAERIDLARALAAGMANPPTFHVGNAGGLPWNQPRFDFTWSRFLFEYLPNPGVVLDEMIRVTKPGGIIAVADLDGQMTHFYPQSDRIASTLKNALSALATTGFDPNVGRKLYGLFRARNLRDVRVSVVPYQNYCGGLPPQALESWRQKLKNGEAVLSKLDHSTDWHALSKELLEAMCSPHLFYYSVLILTTGIVREGAEL